MLKQRLLTASVVIPLAVAAVWFLPNSAFAVLVGLFILAGAWEWATLMRPVHSGVLVAFGTVLIAMVLAVWWFQQNTDVVMAVLAFAAGWWIWCLFRISRYSATSRAGHRPAPLACSVAGLAVLVPAFLALVVLHGWGTRGPAWVLFLFVLVWAADTGAYFAGKALGRTKLVPKVSPGKTWEGVVGGIVLGLLIAVAAGAGLLGLRGATLAGFLVLCAGVIVLSVVGDLTISIMKRVAGVKDSGRLFPGHGGVLDRLDSLLAAGPCFMLGLIGLGLQ